MSQDAQSMPIHLRFALLQVPSATRKNQPTLLSWLGFCCHAHNMWCTHIQAAPQRQGTSSSLVQPQHPDPTQRLTGSLLGSSRLSGGGTAGGCGLALAAGDGFHCQLVHSSAGHEGGPSSQGKKDVLAGDASLCGAVDRGGRRGQQQGQRCESSSLTASRLPRETCTYQSKQRNMSVGASKPVTCRAEWCVHASRECLPSRCRG